jgi:hypothetical protein
LIKSGHVNLWELTFAEKLGGKGKEGKGGKGSKEEVLRAKRFCFSLFPF